MPCCAVCGHPIGHGLSVTLSDGRTICGECLWSAQRERKLREGRE